MVEANRTSIRQLNKLRHASCLAESVNDVENNPCSQLIENGVTSTNGDRRINAVVEPLLSQIEALIKSAKELSGRRSARSCKGNSAAFSVVNVPMFNVS